MSKVTKKLVFLTISLAVLVSPYSSYAKKKPTEMQLPPAVVNMTAVTATQWQNSIEATGSLSAFNGIMVKAEIDGRITKILFKSGQFAKNGQPLIQIYPDIIRAELQQAQAQLNLNELDYQRALKLYQKHFVSSSDLDKARATMTSSQAQVNQFKAQLSQTLIRAPFDGKLGLRQVSLGDYVTAGTGIVNLEALDPIRVDFSVPEIYVSQLKVGQSVSVRSRSFPTETFKGKIYAINSVIDPNTRSLDVRASIPNNQHKLLPGAFVEVTPMLGNPQSVLVVPQTAIVYSADENFVYKVINQKAVKTKVTLGLKLDDNLIIITSGLKTGDQVVSGGQVKIQDGASVMSPIEAQKMISAMPKGTQ